MIRRHFIKRAASVLGLGWMGYEGTQQFVCGRQSLVDTGVFRGDVPDQLDEHSRPADYAVARGNLVDCVLCPHECVLAEGDRGICRTRVVKGGVLHTVAYGNLCAMAVDPVEKKPLYHFLPESRIVSVAMGGCNLRCSNCQNWQISQSKPEDVSRYSMSPAELVRRTVQGGAPSIAYTYTEPMVWFEYVRDASRLARDAGIRNVLVTAGYVNRVPLLELARVVDAVQLDVKSFDDGGYRRIARGRLDPVLRTLVVLRDEGVWTEVSFLMVSGLTDGLEHVGEFARWVVANLGVDVPLHLLRFHPAHRLTHLPPTPVSMMAQGREAAVSAGLRYVYMGNVAGLGGGETRCPKDGELLLERRGFQVVTNRVLAGACPKCGTKIAGVFA